jgi:4-amino-4-deoxy-L-arabinose transferase-like glycosyltransferase
MAPGRWFLWKLWATAFAVRLAGVGLGLWLFPGYLVAADTRGVYYPIARSLAWGTGDQTGPVLGTTIAPLFPCWLALLMRAAGPELPLWLPGLFNAAFRATGVVLVYLLGRRYFGTRAGLLGALLYLFDPWETLWAGYVLKESLAVPLFLLAIWLLCRLDDRRTLRSATAAGAAIGLATLARFPSGGLWVVAFFLLLRLKHLPGGWCLANARGTLGLFLALTTAVVVILSPWLLRNWAVMGQPTLSSHFAGQYFYTSNGPGIEMEQDGYYSPQGIDRELLGKADRPGRPWQKEGHLFQYTLDYLLHHPGEAMQRVLTKVVNMWRPTFGRSSYRNWLLLGFPYCLEMLVCLAGMAIAWRRGLGCSALLVPLLVYIVIHLVFWGEIRNRQYLTPLLFAFGGLALEWLGQATLVSRPQTRMASVP